MERLAMNGIGVERAQWAGSCSVAMGIFTAMAKKVSAELERLSQVLTMQVDTDAGTLKFWVDGKPYGPGYTSRVTGPLRRATTVCNRGNAVQIVPTPAAWIS